MKLLEPKFRRIVRFLAIPAVLIFVLSIAAMASGSISLSYSGITVDEAGRLYLGRGGKIEVYEDGAVVQTIKPPVEKSFFFTLQDGNLLLSTGKETTTLDMDGALLETAEDAEGALYASLKAQKHSCTAPDGTVYTLHREILATQVTAEDGTVLYAEPVWANALKPLLALAGLYVIFAAGYIALDRFATLEATGHLDQV